MGLKLHCVAKGESPRRLCGVSLERSDSAGLHEPTFRYYQKGPRKQELCQKCVAALKRRDSR